MLSNFQRLPTRSRWRVLTLLMALGGCDEVGPREAAESAPVAPTEPLHDGGGGQSTSLAVTPSEREALCARAADDAVRDIFCKGERRTVSSLRELLARLELPTLAEGVDEASASQLRIDSREPIEHAVLLGHSTALSGQLVSPINPRAILLNRQTLVAFQRGVQKAEIITRDRVEARRNLYLVSFEQPCNETPRGCLPGDLYTLSVERDWTSVTLRDDEDLKNTPLDCRQCHARGLEKPTLLMRELLGPWSHFFFFDSDQAPYVENPNTPGREIVRDFLQAKGSETYAGLSSAQLRQTAGVTLQKAVEQRQPLLFNPIIPGQLQIELEPGVQRSPAWDRGFQAFKRGEQLPLPYFEQRATDPAKLASLSDAYARYRAGELPADQLPDLADVFPDDPQTRAEIGLQTEPNASPAETLIQACGSCHNDVLDQTISRARFNIALARMSREELDLAIARIELPADSDVAMPPHGMRQLDPDGKQRLLAYLKEDTRSAEDDALLESAAKLGMAGGGGY